MGPCLRLSPLVCTGLIGIVAYVEVRVEDIQADRRFLVGYDGLVGGCWKASWFSFM